MSDYRCAGCSGPIINGQHVLLATTVVDVLHQQLGESDIYHRKCHPVMTESTGTALGHLAKIEKLQTERAALIRKLGLDWGPDEFGDLSGVHVQSIEITNCPDEYCPGWKDSGICPNNFRHRY